MTLMQHLEELRSRLVKTVLAFLAMGILSWFFYDQILAELIKPLKALPEGAQLIEGGKLIFTSPPEALFVRLKVVAFAGFVLSLPVTLWQLWRFVTPGLYRRERRLAIPFILVSLILFATGASLAITLLPKTIDVLVALAGTEFVLVPRASEYLSFILLMVLAFGGTFEIPIVLIFLSLVGVVTSKGLRKHRRGAIVGALVLAAAVTPTQDPLTMLALGLPLIVLYEATILTIRLLKR